MTLKEIRDWIKPQISGISMAYIGKTDPEKENSLCIYGRASNGSKIAIGGLQNSSYGVKAISILVHWSKNCDTAEQGAQMIYDLFNGTRATIGSKECFFNMQYDEPVPIGTNEHDIYEYVIDLTIIYKRG